MNKKVKQPLFSHATTAPHHRESPSLWRGLVLIAGYFLALAAGKILFSTLLRISFGQTKEAYDYYHSNEVTCFGFSGVLYLAFVDCVGDRIDRMWHQEA